MPDPTSTAEAAWSAMVDGLRAAGDRLAEQTADLSEAERADGYRALLRGLNNQLGRFEVDRERPELVFFNGHREKMFMDNPDFRYWVADIRDDRSYRITGTTGDAVYVSITVYTSGGTLDASASGRIDSDDLVVDADGAFTVDLVPDGESVSGDGHHLALPAGASSVWVRQFHHDVRTDRLGSCEIEPIVTPEPPPTIDPERFAGHLERLGRNVASFPTIFAKSVEFDLEHPNEVRHWSEMTNGAAFTEPNIHYVRGSWQLEPGEALVIEGEAPGCRYWNALLYSRFLNSLDHRSRAVSCTDAHCRLVDGRYRLVLASEPGRGDHTWLDTEGRRFGIFVVRFLQPRTKPELPTLRVITVDDPDDVR